MVNHGYGYPEDNPIRYTPRTHIPGHEELGIDGPDLPPERPGPDETDAARERRRRLEQQPGTLSIEDLLILIRQAVIQPPRPTDGSAGEKFIIRRVRVVTAGTPVQGPGIIVPRGFPVVIRQRHHAGSPTGYFAGSESAVSSTDSRSELSDGDAITLHADRLSDFWFDSSLGNTDFELIVEQ